MDDPGTDSHWPNPTDTWAAEDVAQYWWKDVFHYSAYTNYHQVDYLVKKAVGASDDPWQEVLKNPKILSENITTDFLKNDTSAAFKKTWGSAGRCTSFTIRVVRRLEEHHSPSFNFKIYDLEGHRVARCERTGILIDSSSMAGALVLENGEWRTLEDEDEEVKWKWINGKSKFERRGKLKTSSKELTVQDSMTICLEEVKKKLEPLCLFRSFSSGRAHFHGMIKWILKRGELHLIYDLRTRSTRVIVFDKNGTAETEEECAREIANFIKDYGGPMGPFQWEAGVHEATARAVHAKLWNAAIRAWGYPRLV